MEKNGKASSISSQDIKNLIIILGVAIIVALISNVIYQDIKMSALEKKINSTHEMLQLKNTQNKKEVLDKAIKDVSDPVEELFNCIKENQNRYIKLSTGYFDYNCFTDIDLNNFHSNEVPKQIADKLQSDSKFLALVMVIKNLSSDQWEKLKSEALLIYRPTFGDVGGVKTDGSAQSVAGQQAEKIVAETIVNLVSEIKKKNKSDIAVMIE